MMNSRTGIAFSIVAIAAVMALFASGPLVHDGFGFHHSSIRSSSIATSRNN
jgi:hypothetical protein